MITTIVFWIGVICTLILLVLFILSFIGGDGDIDSDIEIETDPDIDDSDSNGKEFEEIKEE